MWGILIDSDRPGQARRLESALFRYTYLWTLVKLKNKPSRFVHSMSLIKSGWKRHNSKREQNERGLCSIINCRSGLPNLFIQNPNCRRLLTSFSQNVFSQFFFWSQVWDEAKRLRCEWFNDYEKTASKPPMVIADLDVIQLDFRGRFNMGNLQDRTLIYNFYQKLP